MDISEKINNEIKSFVEAKNLFNVNVYNALIENNRKRIFELLIENGVEDIRFCSKLRYLQNKDPDPAINDERLEKLKLHLFKMMK